MSREMVQNRNLTTKGTTARTEALREEITTARNKTAVMAGHTTTMAGRTTDRAMVTKTTAITVPGEITVI